MVSKETSLDDKGCCRWMVVVSAFFIGFLTDGLTLSFGVLLVEFLEEFQDERATTTIIGSLAAGTMHLVGPLAGLLSDILGGRTVVILGTLISFGGFVGATFSQSLLALSVSYGFFGGLGFGFMYLPANVSVIKHFKKRRALASGIAVSGSGVGTFLFNLFTRYLIDEYTWRKAILVIAGILLHGIPCGLLLIPPATTGGNTEHNPNEDENIENDAFIKSKPCRGQNPSKEESVINVQEIKLCRGLISSQEECKKEVHKMKPFAEYELKKGDITVSKPTHGQMLVSCGEENIKQAGESKLSAVQNTNTDDNKHDTKESSACPSAGLNKGESVVDVAEDSMTRFTCVNVTNCKAVLYTNLRLLSDFGCICFLVSTFVVNLAFIIPYSLLPDQALDTGMTKYQGSWLVSAIGISNTVSRVVFGWLSDKKCVNRMVVFQALLILIGVNTALSPLLTSFQAKMTYSCIHGFLLGGYVALIPVVLADMYGARLIEESFGLVMCAIGVAVVISLPVGGWIFDQTGSYDITFVVAGSEFAAGGLILLCPWVVQRLRRRGSADITT